MRYLQTLTTLTVILAIFAAPTWASETLETNRQWDVLPSPNGDEGRQTLAAAAESLASLDVTLAAEPLTEQRLSRLAGTPAEGSLIRALRESLGQAIDRRDFLLFLDDVARAQPERVRVHSGRARRAGILLHPDDVFKGEPRRYGGQTLAIAPPPRPPDLDPAPDGAPLGERWSARYPNPPDETERLRSLEAEGGGDFRERIEKLIEQLRDQGAEVHVLATVRRRERGYLMYGAFTLSRASTRAQVEQRTEELDRLNREWDLDIPIQWQHPDGWRTTIEAAKEMAEAYNVVYATRHGARHSNHYGAGAIDLSVTRLPRRLQLQAPDGTERTFDLSGANEPRDLNLTPRLIEWIEAHYKVRKLRSDYPHWGNATSD
jgi:hypothetical protein